MMNIARCRWGTFGGALRTSAAALLVSLFPMVAAAANSSLPKTITIIDPYPAGGLGDVLPRAVANVLQQETGRTFVVLNKPGATQIIGALAAKQAPKDGSVILFGSVTTFALNPIVRKKLPYDPQKDFDPISLTFVTPMYLIARNTLPVKSVQDLIALAKREPGKLSYASGGIGSSTNLAGELFKTLSGTSITHVPYAGTGPAVRDVIAGNVDLMFTGSGLTYAKQGLVKILGVSSAKRTDAAPNVPTLEESGVKGFDATIWFGFVAPAGVPKPFVTELSAEIKKAIDSGAVLQKLKAGGENIEGVGSTPAQFKAFIAKEIPKWRKVVEDAHIEPR
jgi:tripartite-type tricarboxylate transporter receptor subunit TctC